METILVIDDETSIRENVSEMLSAYGYEVIAAKDGAQGIQEALKHTPELILCDINMPNIDGYEVFRTLEQIPTTALIPFIFLTAKTQLQDLRKGMQLGADDYIMKPFQFKDLLASVQRRIEKYRKLNQAGERKFIALSETPFNGVFVLVDCFFAFVNEKFAQMTGYTSQMLEKKKLPDMLLPENDNTAEVAACLEGVQKGFQGSIAFRLKNGESGKFQLFIKCIKTGSQQTAIGAITPVSEAPENRLPDDFEEMITLLVENAETASQIIEFSRSYTIEKQRKSKKTDVQITRRESEVLQLICKGYTNMEIAAELFISNRTADNHRQNLLMKTNAKNTASLVAFAFRNGIVEM